MTLERAKEIVVYKSKRLFYAMCYNGSDELLNRIIEEEKALQRKRTESKQHKSYVK